MILKREERDRKTERPGERRRARSSEPVGLSGWPSYSGMVVVPQTTATVVSKVTQAQTSLPKVTQLLRTELGGGCDLFGSKVETFLPATGF